jgi:hypothetical protein
VTHIDDLAELYALGSLDERERVAVDAHVAQCPACLRKLGEAEETLLALEAQYVPVQPPAALDENMRFERKASSGWWLVVAAAFVIGLLPSVPLLLQRQAHGEGDIAAIAILHSHFSHSQFSGADSAPSAKVLYARDRAWLYVMVEGAQHYDVYKVRGGIATRLGTIAPQGATSNLFVELPGALDRVELRSGTALVETAQIR